MFDQDFEACFERKAVNESNYSMPWAYMQKTCDVAVKAILAKKIAEKVRKLRQKCVNRENR